MVVMEIKHSLSRAGGPHLAHPSGAKKKRHLEVGIVGWKARATKCFIQAKFEPVYRAIQTWEVGLPILAWKGVGLALPPLFISQGPPLKSDFFPRSKAKLSSHLKRKKNQEAETSGPSFFHPTLSKVEEMSLWDCRNRASIST